MRIDVIEFHNGRWLGFGDDGWYYFSINKINWERLYEAARN